MTSIMTIGHVAMGQDDVGYCFAGHGAVGQDYIRHY